MSCPDEDSTAAQRLGEMALAEAETWLRWRYGKPDPNRGPIWPAQQDDQPDEVHLDAAETGGGAVAC